MKLEAKNILITGANRGIGLALAQQAAQKRMGVHILSRSRNDEVEQELQKLGATKVCHWDLNLESPQSIEQFAKHFYQSGEACDLLVNNAGQLTGGLLEEQPVDSILSMLQVNLAGLIHLTRLMLPMMLEQSEAKIVNNASVSGIMSLPCASTYAASKAGVVAFTESLRNELEGTSVSTLLMVTPGVKTRMYDAIPSLYGSHMKLDFLSSVSPEEWAQKVFLSIENDRSICWPSGPSYWSVKLGQHFPKLLGRMVRPYFKR